MDGRFSSCRDRGHIGTIILASCPSLKSHAAVHSASWWPQRKSWDPADLAQPFMGRVFGWPWCLKILSWRWWIFTLYRVLVTDMVCAPKALKGIDTLDPFPPPSHNVAMKMQSIQFLTFPSPALTRAPTVSTWHFLILACFPGHEFNFSLLHCSAFMFPEFYIFSSYIWVFIPFWVYFCIWCEEMF